MCSLAGSNENHEIQFFFIWKSVLVIQYGDTALHWASYSGHIETVDELLKSDAININTLNKVRIA